MVTALLRALVTAILRALVTAILWKATCEECLLWKVTCVTGLLEWGRAVRAAATTWIAIKSVTAT